MFGRKRGARVRGEQNGHPCEVVSYNRLATPAVASNKSIHPRLIIFLFIYFLVFSNPPSINRFSYTLHIPFLTRLQHGSCLLCSRSPSSLFAARAHHYETRPHLLAFPFSDMDRLYVPLTNYIDSHRYPDLPSAILCHPSYEMVWSRERTVRAHRCLTASSSVAVHGTDEHCL